MFCFHFAFRPRGQWTFQFQIRVFCLFGKFKASFELNIVNILYFRLIFQKMADRHPRFNRYCRQRYTGGRPVFVPMHTNNANDRIVGIPPANTPGFGLMPAPKVGSKPLAFTVNRSVTVNNGGPVDKGGSVWQVHQKGISGGFSKSVVVDSNMSFPRNSVLMSPTYQDFSARRAQQPCSSSQAKAREAYVRDQEYGVGHINHVPVDNGSHEVGLSPNSFFDVQADKAADLAIASEFGKI